MGGVGEGIFARGGRGVGEKVVGATRFELVTFCTPSKRATSLRYAPTKGESMNIGATGFEPATSWSRTKRSTRLSHAPVLAAMAAKQGGL